MKIGDGMKIGDEMKIRPLEDTGWGTEIQENEYPKSFPDEDEWRSIWMDTGQPTRWTFDQFRDKLNACNRLNKLFVYAFENERLKKENERLRSLLDEK